MISFRYPINSGNPYLTTSIMQSHAHDNQITQMNSSGNKLFYYQ